jgi:serine/threonine protein kinase/tetratricopeptide (TPR) repeat protein
MEAVMTEEELFHEALSKPPSERAAFLENACTGKPELRAAVEALLSAHEASDGLLADSKPRPSQTEATGEYAPNPQFHQRQREDGTIDFRPDVDPGFVVAGRYTLQEKIGEGGMGEVWVAKQSEPVKRKVALKLIKAGMDSRYVLQRFDQERQALAMMDHPNIAKVLDGGLTAEHRPYFVMELVNGLPLTKFCDDMKLGIRERLELFVPICLAVQHAHQKGVIHRDLKPSNILVTMIDGKPTPKVIDFGVAKATAGKLTDESVSTQFGAVVGTLEYISPEQAGYSGDDVDTRADVYSLGVVLYELLTGLRPIDGKRLEKAAIDEMIRIIREEEPSKPSTRLSTDASAPSLAAVRKTAPQQLSALLRGELDWVVMKCLEKQRDRRYETANGLARDIQRYLADEPVEARPPSFGYRASKFLKRHRGPAVAAGIVAAALVAGVVGTTWGLIRARDAEAKAVEERDEKIAAFEKAKAEEEEAKRQRERAREGFRQAREAVDRAFTVVSENKLLLVPGMQPLRKQLLEEALQYYRDFSQRWADEPGLRHDIARGYFRLAKITGDIGSKTQAIADYRQALRRFEELQREQPNDPAFRSIQAICRHNIGQLLQDQHQFAEALAEHERSLAMWLELAKEFPKDAEIEDGLALVRSSISHPLDALQRHREALEHLDAALAVHRRQVAENPKDPRRRHSLAGVLDSRSHLQMHMGDIAGAVKTINEAIAEENAAVSADPTSVEYRSFLGNHYFNLAVIHEMRLDQPAEALAARMAAVGVWEKLAAENPAVTDYRGRLAIGLLDIGNTLLYQLPSKGDPTPNYRRARELLETLIREQPEVGRHHSSLAAVLDGLAYQQIQAKKLDEARTLLEDAVRHQRRAVELAEDVDQFHRFLASHYMNLARVEQQLDQPAKVRAALTNAIPVFERVIQDKPDAFEPWRDLATSHHSIGTILASEGLTAEALASHRRGADVAKRLTAARPQLEEAVDLLTASFEALANALEQAGKSVEVAAVHEEEAEFWGSRRATMPPSARAMIAHATACLQRGEIAADKQDWKTGLDWFEKARESYQTALRLKPADAAAATLQARTLKWIGDLHYLLKESPKAKAAWEEALPILQKTAAVNQDDPSAPQRSIGGILHNLGRLHSDAGEHAKALTLYQEAVRIQKLAFARNAESARPWLHNHLSALASAHRELKQPEPAAAAVRERVKLWPKDAIQHVRAAGELAQCLPLMTGDPKRADSLAEECLGLLRTAKSLGFSDMASATRASEFESLRKRESFNKWLKEVKPPASSK